MDKALFIWPRCRRQTWESRDDAWLSRLSLLAMTDGRVSLTGDETGSRAISDNEPLPTCCIKQRRPYVKQKCTCLIYCIGSIIIIVIRFIDLGMHNLCCIVDITSIILTKLCVYWVWSFRNHCKH